MRLSDSLPMLEAESWFLPQRPSQLGHRNSADKGLNGLKDGIQRILASH